MSLLEDIVEGARNSDTPVAQLLRSLRVLAARGRVDDLAEWVKREISGYGEEYALPSYRGPFVGHTLGYFSGPFGSEVTIVLSDLGFPDYFKESLFSVELHGPIAVLENMLAVDAVASSNPATSPIRAGLPHERLLPEVP